MTENVLINKCIELAQIESLVVRMIYQQGGNTPTRTLEELNHHQLFREYLQEVKRLLPELKIIF